MACALVVSLSACNDQTENGLLTADGAPSAMEAVPITETNMAALGATTDEHKGNEGKLLDLD